MRLAYDGFGASFYPDQQLRETWKRYIALLAEAGTLFVWIPCLPAPAADMERAGLFIPGSIRKDGRRLPGFTGNFTEETVRHRTGPPLLSEFRLSRCKEEGRLDFIFHPAVREVRMEYPLFPAVPETEEKKFSLSGGCDGNSGRDSSRKKGFRLLK